MNRLTRVLPGVALLLAAALALACGQKPAEIRLKSPKLKVYGLGRVVSVGGDVVDKKGEIVPGKTVTWESSNPKVATVNAQTGSVKTVGRGEGEDHGPARRPAPRGRRRDRGPRRRRRERLPRRGRRSPAPPGRRSPSRSR